ncbi:MAG: hypothetical protein GWM98_06095 [Nitrospinaceae bacterium]|nr:hypothetical protein [Nitrospinaceae bacterium]NIR54135.1 hypothetical protein [Nitrospinaceae bacterium]NIS84549.1 hypothetical protein [Nitrospinaceae bacterium]NIT81341.1 hypothetical protein [Nitrospinaceae bacterium]NIU43628.1 hypothetical protein [Nitrospinaceae bacterium]
MTPARTRPTARPAPEPPAANPNPDPPEDPVQPQGRRVIQAPVLSSVAPEETDSGEIVIKAQPSPMGDQCTFLVNRGLMKGYSWFFPRFESAEGSPLAEALFSLDDIETVLVVESQVTVTRKDKSQPDWRPLAREVGAVLRQVLQEGGDWVAPKIFEEIPSEEDIRAGIQEVLDREVNPGVAGHGGRITLTSVKGNTVTIEMGGGCQGCSAADLTLKQGIHQAFRTAVPQVGAILDETDHSAGLNPYFS